MDKVSINPYGLWEVGVEISHKPRKKNAIKSKARVRVTISLQTLFICLCECVFACAI